MAQELKTYDFPVDGDFTATVELFYLKSDVDKVLAEKDEEIAGLKVKLKVQTSNAEKAWKLKDSYHTNYAEAVKELYDKNKEIRHQKYKRCLAMAKWCASRSASWCLDPADDELHKSDFYDKWKLRWLELAEKFKEGT